MSQFVTEPPDNKSIRKTSETLEYLANATKEYNKEASKQTRQMVKLTKAMLWLTGVMVFGLVVQIALAWPNK